MNQPSCNIDAKIDLQLTAQRCYLCPGEKNIVIHINYHNCGRYLYSLLPVG